MQKTKNVEKTIEVARRCFVKKVFLKLSKNTCARVSFLVKFQIKHCIFIKKRRQHRYFPVKFAEFILLITSSGINKKRSKVHKHSFIYFCFSIWVFYHEHSRIAGQQGKGEVIYLTPLYHFHPLHSRLDIGRAIAAGGSPLRMAGSRQADSNRGPLVFERKSLTTKLRAL